MDHTFLEQSHHRDNTLGINGLFFHFLSISRQTTVMRCCELKDVSSVDEKQKWSAVNKRNNKEEAIHCETIESQISKFSSLLLNAY